MGLRLAKVLVLAALALAIGASGGSAATPAHPRILGVVPHAGLQVPTLRPLWGPAGLPSPSFLTYDAKYETLINQYFTDVAHDSNTANNVYSVATQYSDGSGSVKYQSTFAGSYVSHAPLPASGCDDGVDSVCLTDQQLQNEIQTVLTATGWHGGLNHVFFLMTPNGVGSCEDSTNTQCSTYFYCAYHSYFVDTNGENVIYANEPYLGPSGNCSSPSQGFPNDLDSDTTINTISHEHNEAITDPLTDPANYAWIANDGNENGDLCAYIFGTQTNPEATAYNQTINGHHYDLQEEYSNIDHGCIQRPGGAVSAPNVSEDLPYNGGPVMHSNTTYAIYWLPTAGNTSAPIVTGAAGVNKTLTTTPGTWVGAPTGYSDQWQRCSTTGTGCADIPGATATTYQLTSADGGHTVRSTVRATNVNGTSPPAASATSAVIALIPAATAAPVVSGVNAVHKPLSTTNGTWNSVVTYAYAWLRCAADGSGCAAIPGAAAATYVLTAADAGHTLEARVTATNAAGTTAALSNRSGGVIGVPHATKAPHISGRARVGKKLSGSRGSWTYSPTAERDQWLRCNAHGGSCRAIPHATHSTYRLAKSDAGHRLKLRVTARNAAGSATVTSSATARVPASR